VNVYLPKDRVTNNHQGYGFVEYRAEEDADYVRSTMAANLDRTSGSIISRCRMKHTKAYTNSRPLGGPAPRAAMCAYLALPTIQLAVHVALRVLQLEGSGWQHCVARASTCACSVMIPCACGMCNSMLYVAGRPGCCCG
jgi:hypothetical protein